MEIWQNQLITETKEYSSNITVYSIQLVTKNIFKFAEGPMLRILAMPNIEAFCSLKKGIYITAKKNSSGVNSNFKKYIFQELDFVFI